MHELDARNLQDYLRNRGHIGPCEAVRVRELTGGVSNMVFLVERDQGAERRFVLEQARSQLRTAQPWFSRVERIWREADVLGECARLLTLRDDTQHPSSDLAATTPRILFEDRDQYLFAMTAAPEPNVVWKQDLLADHVRPEIAAACGRLLATLHGASWLDRELQQRLGDCTLFDELRVDPYYRTLAITQPDARSLTDELIASMAAHPRSLVHADFSPKNLLVYRDGLMMVDFETGHFGDPAFDLGFFLSHLVLKACYKIPRHAAFLELSQEFSRSYSHGMAAYIDKAELASLWSRGVRHFAGCAWARLDGKSPVDYLTDPARRDQMRDTCRAVVQSRAATWAEVIAICRERFDAIA